MPDPAGNENIGVRSVGVRDLRNRASRIVRAVHEEMTEYVITVRGEPVAVLRPFTDEDAHRLKKGH